MRDTLHAARTWLRSWTNWTFYLLFVGFALGPLGLIAASRYDRVAEGPDGTTSLTIWTPQASQSLEETGFALLLGLYVLAALALLRKQWILGIVSAAAGWWLRSMMAMVVLAMAVDPAPWQLQDCGTVADGGTYCTLQSAFLQGRTVALGRRTDTTRWTKSFELVAEASGDDRRMTQTLLRPTTTEGRDSLHVSADGTTVIAVLDRNCAYLAYDTSTDRRWLDCESNPDAACLDELSPFLLLGDRTDPRDQDVDRLLDDTNRCPGSAPDELPDDVRDDALQHPNPSVREVAERFFQTAGGD